MQYAKFLGILRHALTALGVFLVSFGVVDQSIISGVTEAVLAIIGGVMTIAGFIASIKAPEKN